MLTFEHGHGMRAYWHVEETVNPQLGDCRSGLKGLVVSRSNNNNQ